MGSALKLFKILIHVALAFLGIVIVFLTVYLLGWELLETPFKGNELTFVTTMADWVDRWLFQGVQWYPAHGGGVSVTQSTQIEVYYVISFLHRFTGLSLIQTTKLLSFLLIFLVSLEIYFLVWWRFKSQTMAFLAAFFFPLSQAAWIEITYLGVLALPFSVLFILPAFFLFDLYLRERKAKIFVLVVFTFGLIFLAHIIIAELVTGILLVWALLFPYVFSAKNKWESLKFGLLAWFKTVFLGSLLISFWFLPFLHYVGIVGRNLISFKTLGQVNYVTLPFLLGFGDAWGGKSELALFFALPVLIFAFLGFLVAIFKKDKLVILLSFLAILFLIYPSLPYFVPQFVQVFFMNIVEQSYERAFAIPLVILPILASYGLFQGSKLILFPLKGSIGVVLVSFLAIFLAGLGIVVFRHVPPPPPEAVPCYFGYGPWFYSETVNDYCRFWDKLKNFRLSLGEERLPFDEKMQAILEKTGIDSQSRLDISPLHGSLVMALPLYSQASTVNIQLNIASLNKILWGYQVGSFYVRHDFGGPREVASLASWFGIEHLVLSSADPLEKYTADYWKEVVDEKGLIIKKFKGPAGMVTLSSQPKILVLGKFKNRAYEQFFRLANAGAYPYGKAMFVEGKDSGQIDDYSLEELKKFEMILLYGYTYKDQKKAFDLLENYVKDGGRLFIETGWQYVSPDWQMTQTPEILPVAKLTWKEYQGDWVEGFSQASYQGGPWGVSAASISDLRPWVKSKLNFRDNVLVASGNLGKGKVVWSGMNLIGHALNYRNQNEFDFFRDQIDWLLEDFTGEDKTTQVSFNRINPDKIEFIFSQPQQNSWLYWRENFYPDWQARLSNGEKLPIYRAGPNFMLLSLGKMEKGERVILELVDSPRFIFSRILSVIVFIFLLILFFKEDWLKKAKEKIKIPGGKILASRTKGWWDKEEES